MSTHKYNCGHETFWEDDRTIIVKDNLLCPMCKVYAENRVTRTCKHCSEVVKDDYGQFIHVRTGEAQCELFAEAGGKA
jgi:hypothetical protein